MLVKDISNGTRNITYLLVILFVAHKLRVCWNCEFDALVIAVVLGEIIAWSFVWGHKPTKAPRGDKTAETC